MTKYSEHAPEVILHVQGVILRSVGKKRRIRISHSKFLLN